MQGEKPEVLHFPQKITERGAIKSMGKYDDVIDGAVIGYTHCARDRALLKRRFCDGITIEALAEEFDMSPQNVKRIVRKGRDLTGI